MENSSVEVMLEWNLLLYPTESSTKFWASDVSKPGTSHDWRIRRTDQHYAISQSAWPFLS